MTEGLSANSLYLIPAIQDDAPRLFCTADRRRSYGVGALFPVDPRETDEVLSVYSTWVEALGFNLLGRSKSRPLIQRTEKYFCPEGGGRISTPSSKVVGIPSLATCSRMFAACSDSVSAIRAAAPKMVLS